MVFNKKHTYAVLLGALFVLSGVSAGEEPSRYSITGVQLSDETKMTLWERWESIDRTVPINIAYIGKKDLLNFCRESGFDYEHFCDAMNRELYISQDIKFNSEVQKDNLNNLINRY